MTNTRKSRHFAWLACAACLLAAGCSTAFADFEDGAPAGNEYPSFHDLPPAPEIGPDDPTWSDRAGAMISAREALDAQTEAVFAEAPPDAEAAQ